MLRKSCFLILILLIYISCQAFHTPKSVVDYVNPLIGTDSEHKFSHGNIYPAIAMPFGMTAWAPQTGERSGWIYQYQKTTINGIKATHQPSPWIGDYGDFAIMPMIGELKTDRIERESAFQHANEIARPSYYRVLLDKDDIEVEITPTERCACFRITYPQSTAAYLLLDAFRGEVVISPDGKKMTGIARSNEGGVPENFGCYFIFLCDKSILELGTLSADSLQPGQNQVSGEQVGAYLKFSTAANEPVHLKIGTSFISHEQAELNLENEIGTRSFSDVESKTRADWNKLLSRIEIKGASEDQLITFYSNFYRALLFPRIFHEFDRDGKMIHYSPYNGQIHAGEMYTDNGFWDTFRAVYPFFTLLFPDLDASMIRGWINSAKEGGWFPKWASPGYRDCMIGTHVESLIADALSKGINNFDLAAAYQACYRDATDTTGGGATGRTGLADYIRKGYVPCDKVREATARTLEFAYDDWCVAQVARYCGKSEDANLLSGRSQNFRNVYDPQVGFMRGRLANGSWRPDFDPTEWGGPFTEGSAWHYSWSVLHDVGGLIQFMGGDEKFVTRLDEMFETAPTFQYGHYQQEIHEMTEMVACKMGQYAHGNQPVHHVLYLYNYAGQPWKGAKQIRKAVDTLYGPDPDGYCGDEDNGQMSAWYLFSVFGFYPVCPGQPSYVIGTPRYDEITLHLENGKKFVIKASNNSDANIFIQKAALNGEPYQLSWLKHEDIMAGGEIEFFMGPNPELSWGADMNHRPLSMTKR
jgi:predicted alpha-1,2-mannosidase